MGHKPKDTPIGAFDDLTLSKICSNCKTGNYQAHHQYPHKYASCALCGHTKEVKNKIDSVIETGDYYKRGEGKG